MNKAERIASRGLQFLFAPQLGAGLAGVRGLFAAFVQSLAQILARARLLEPTHRALNPTSYNDIRMGEIVAHAYATLRRPGKHTADQYAVFMAVTGMLVLSTAAVFTFVAKTLIGTAHAQLIASGAPVACATAASASIFTAPCSNDMAQQWIDMLLLGNTTSWFANQVVSLPLANGLAALFGTYSVGMLVLAGFLVLYHMLSIVAETAHEGRFGGRGFNHVWAPIRLVMAVGLLIPLGGFASGLNSGQYIVTQVAKWGSGLASNAWASFATTITNSMGAYAIFPTLPAMSNVLKEALKIKICEKAYNLVAAQAGPPAYNIVRMPPLGSAWMPTADGKHVELSWNKISTSGSAGGRDYTENACGHIIIPNPAIQISGRELSYLGAQQTLSAGDQFRQNILLAHINAIESVMAGPLEILSSEIVAAVGDKYNYAINSLTPNAVEVPLTKDNLMMFRTAVTSYRAIIGTAISNQIANSTLANQDFAITAAARGWVSAAAWFNTIASLNGQILDSAQQKPQAMSVATKFAGDGEGEWGFVLEAVATANQAIRTLPLFMTQDNDTWPEQGFLDALGAQAGTASDADYFDRFLQHINYNISQLIGADANADNLTGTVGNWAATFQLNTANPLAELSSLGFRMIGLAKAATKMANVCKEKDMNYVEVSGPRSYNGKAAACGNAEIDPTASALTSVFASFMIGAGVSLAFVLPLLPFIRFMFGLVTWLVALLEAVVAIPLVALAHIKTDGDGLSGPMARSAYLLVLQIFARPILMIFGLVLALLIFNLMIVALNELYATALRSVEGSGNIGAMSGIVYCIIYGTLAYGFANAAFKAIDLIPNQALQWIGGQNVSTIDESYRVQQGVGQLSAAANYASQIGRNSDRASGYLLGQAGKAAKQ